MVRNQNELEFRSLACVPSGQSPPAIPANSKLLGVIRGSRKPEAVQSNLSWLERRLPDEELQFIRDARFDFLVPIAVGSRHVEALLALGIKRSEEPYTREDQELLEAIASGMALLLTQPAEATPRPSAFSECPHCGACYDAASANHAKCTRDGFVLISVPSPRLLSGRYRLDRRIGSGGMGAVYEAKDVALERDVAVKVIREDLVSSPQMALATVPKGSLRGCRFLAHERRHRL